MPAGYSGTPLARKLGIKPGHRVVLVNPPRGFRDTLVGLPDDVAFVAPGAARDGINIVVAFCGRAAAVAKTLEHWPARIHPDGAIWLGWPKKSSGVVTDITEDHVRETALAAGLVDNKVCAIDDTWSGLRVVYRLADRPKLKKR